MLGAFLAFLGDVFFGRRELLEAFGNFIQNFRPNAVVIDDFLFEIEAPSQILTLRVDKVDDESGIEMGGDGGRCFLRGGGVYEEGEAETGVRPDSRTAWSTKSRFG